MKDNGIKKTQFPVSTAVLCGIIIAAAAILFAIITAAMTGAFELEEASERESSASFSGPESSEQTVPTMPEIIDEDPSVRVTIETAFLRPTAEGLEYETMLAASYSGSPAHITSVRCSVCRGAEHIYELKLAEPFDLENGSMIILTGTGDITLEDMSDIGAVFCVEWEDLNGRRGNAFVYAKAQAGS